MYYIKHIYTVILLCFCLFNKAQTLQFDNYTTKNGLISDEVYKLRQDKKGYIWMFTNYGAMKYNGKTFQTVLKNLPFDESFIYAFYENSEGKCWIANSNCKIYEVKNDSAFQVSGTENFSSNLNKNQIIISEFVVDKDGNIYIPTLKTLLKFIKSEGYREKAIAQVGFTDSTYGSLLEIEKNTMFSIFNYEKSLKKINSVMHYKIQFINDKNKILKDLPIVFKAFNYSSSVPKNFIKNSDKLFFAFNFSVYKFHQNKIKEIPFSSYVLHHTIDKNGHLWVATLNNGLYELNTQDSVINHYFENRTINHILFDSQNGLWVSSEGTGVFNCRNLQQFHCNMEDNKSSAVNFIKKIGNKLVLANTNGSVFIIDGKKTYNCSTNAKNEVIDAIEIHENSFVIVSRFHLDLVTLKKDRLFSEKLPFIKPAFHPLKIFKLGHDSLLALSKGTFVILNEGISSLNKEQFVIRSKYKLYSFLFRNNQLLFATENGVFEYINHQFIRPNYLIPTEKCVITSFIEDSRHNVWICSKGSGLFKLTENNKLFHYTTEKGLPSDVINGLSFTTGNSILLSTNIGLFHSSKFKKWNEIYSEQVKASFSFKKDIYFLTKDGLVIDKGGVVEGKRNVYFNLASIFLNGIISNENEILKLNHIQNNLEFNFDVITNSSNIPDIFFKLNGEKKEEGLIQNQQIILKNLPPGKYTLDVKLLSNNINYTPINIEFYIKPAFWQTNWFLVLLLLLLLSIVMSTIIFLLFYQFKMKKENAKNHINQMISEYKLIALKAQINPHFMSNCLTAIQQLIHSEKLQAANQYIAKFSFLIRQVLNFSSKNLITLKEELEISKLYIDLEMLRFEDKFSINIKLEPELLIHNIYVSPLIMQPIIENAIWHGLLPLKNRKGIIDIYVSKTDDRLFIIIKDNGVGRRINNAAINNIKASKGLDIIKQRILNLNTIYPTTKSDLIIEDIVDENKVSMGTRVKIIIPFLNSDQHERD